jgi:hypothetical protein
MSISLHNSLLELFKHVLEIKTLSVSSTPGSTGWIYWVWTGCKNVGNLVLQRLQNGTRRILVRYRHGASPPERVSLSFSTREMNHSRPTSRTSQNLGPKPLCTKYQAMGKCWGGCFYVHVPLGYMTPPQRRMKCQPDSNRSTANIPSGPMAPSPSNSSPPVSPSPHGERPSLMTSAPTPGSLLSFFPHWLMDKTDHQAKHSARVPFVQLAKSVLKSTRLETSQPRGPGNRWSKVSKPPSKSNAGNPSSCPKGSFSTASTKFYNSW